MKKTLLLTLMQTVQSVKLLAVVLLMFFPLIASAQQVAETGYYLIGDHNNWDMSDKSYAFTKLDDDKTWEITIPSEGVYCFKIAPESAYEYHDVSFWSYLLCAEYDQYTGLSGVMMQGEYGAWLLNVDNAIGYTIRIVPSEMTFEIKAKLDQYLTVLKKDGTKTSFNLKDNLQLSFDGSSLVINANGFSKSISIDDIVRLTYEDLMIGDANGDGKVNVADITTIINYGKGIVTDDFSFNAADANGDKTIDSRDIDYIVDYLLNRDNAPSSGSTPSVNKSSYIYRNDGDFNAFFHEEINNITYSNIGVKGTNFENIVTQVVTTADKVYYIPLAAIDSISFDAPETIINNKVFPLTADHNNYIIYSNDEEFCIHSSAPASLLPAVGNIVVCSYDCVSFLNGYLGRVDRIETDNIGYHYYCSQATYDDVFDQIVIHEQLEGNVGEDNGSAATRGGDPDAKSFHLWDRQWNYPVETEHLKAEMKLANISNATVTIRKTKKKQPLYWKLEITNAFSGSISFNGEEEKSYKEQVQLGKTITAGRLSLPYTLGLLWLEPKMSLFEYLEASAKMELEFYANFMHSDKVTMTYNKGEWDFGHIPSTTGDVDVARLNLSGSLEFGFIPQIDFSLNGTQAGFGIKGKVGVREFANFEFDAKSAVSDGLYDALIDSYCSTTLPWSVTVHANANIFDKYDAKYKGEEKTYTFEPDDNNIPHLLDDMYIFPLFSNLYARGTSGNNSTAWCQGTATRKCLFPMKLGFQLYDVNNQPLEPIFQDQEYFDSQAPFSVDVSGLGGGKYIVRPVVYMMDRNFVASPQTELVKVATFPGEKGDGTFTMKGKLYGATSDKIGFYYNTTSDLTSETATYVSATPTNSNGDFSATIANPEGSTLFFVAAADLPDLFGQVEENRGEPQIASLVVNDSDEPTPGQVVDLGLSVKWAGWDIGSSNPEEPGDLFAWGETQTKSEFTEENYSLMDDDEIMGHKTATGLNGAHRSIAFCSLDDISATQYDTARAKWGSSWRMPTVTETTELINNCAQKNITYKGQNGVLFTGPNGNKVFMPVTENDDYWTSTFEDVSRFTANGMSWSTSKAQFAKKSRIRVYYGLRVRAVCD